MISGTDYQTELINTSDRCGCLTHHHIDQWGQRSPGSELKHQHLYPPPLLLSLSRSAAVSSAASTANSLRRWTGGRELTDGGDEGGVEGVLAEPEQQAGLPDAAVPDQQQLEQVVVRLRHFPAVSPGAPGGLTEPPASHTLLGTLVLDRVPLKRV